MSGAGRHFVIAAGGTGGHMVPAHVLGQAFKARGHSISLITDARGLLIPAIFEDCPRHVIPAAPLGGNPMAWVKNFLTIRKGRNAARALFQRENVAAVIGFGGYPTLPALWAARSLGIATIIHEQNAVLGRVNRLLAPRVDAIATAYPEVAKLPAKWGAKTHMVGNPVRAEIVALREKPYPALLPDGIFRLLVIGGSQGATILSDVVPAALEMLPAALRFRCHVVQQCRSEDIERVRARYTKNQIPAEIASYMIDMEAQLARAHLVVARAGASTVAEVAVAGRPAILVPLPTAMDDHQSANARWLAQGGGARVIAQKDFTPAALARQIQRIALSPGELSHAADRARAMGVADAGERLALLAERMAGLMPGFGAPPKFRKDR